MIDYSEFHIKQTPDLEVCIDIALDADAILEFGFQDVCLATGLEWHRDEVSRQYFVPMPISESAKVFTPDDDMVGLRPSGHVIIYDFDHYFMGGVLAELLLNERSKVTFVTPAAYISDWTVNTLEEHVIHRRLAGLDVKIVLSSGVVEIAEDHVISNFVFIDKTERLACDAVLMLASKMENNDLYLDLRARKVELASINSVKLIGDANAPGPIAWATYAGHRYARELDEPDLDDVLPIRREFTELAID